MASTRARIPKSLIGIACLFALLFAGSIEALTNHHHDDLSGSQQCVVCQVVHAAGETPRTPAPAPVVLPENPCRPNDSIHLGPGSSHLVVIRLRAPPTP